VQPDLRRTDDRVARRDLNENSRPDPNGDPGRPVAPAGGSSPMHAHVLGAANWAVTRLLRAGVPLRSLALPGGAMALLTVPGRRSGQPRTTPVDVFARAGRRWLVATHGEGNWVRNLRAAGRGALRRGAETESVTATELDPTAAATVLAELLRPLLASPVRRAVVRLALGLSPSASPDDLLAAVRRCPVFELGPAPSEPPIREARGDTPLP
jgi:deazaflavin-dependent oxidoreductase (nitroreductase family)